MTGEVEDERLLWRLPASVGGHLLDIKRTLLIAAAFVGIPFVFLGLPAAILVVLANR